MRDEAIRLGGLRWVLPALLVALLCFPVAAGAATFTVDDIDDVGDANAGADATCDATGGDGCTLRAAIETAQGSGSTGVDVIELPSDVAISLGEFSFFDNGALTIRGTGAVPSIIDANDSSRLFNASGVPLTLENLELREGAVVGYGGAIQYQAVDSSDVLRLEDSSVEDSEAAENGGALAQGGGISATGTSPTLQLVDSDVTGNTVGDSDSPGFGGGLAVTGTAPTVSVTSSSSVSSNAAVGATTGTGARGGGIGVISDSASAPFGSVTVNSSAVALNRAGGNGSSQPDYGGGIYVQGPSGSPNLNVTAAQIDNNVAGGGSGNAEGRGGGVMVADDGGTVTLNGAGFNGNRAGGNDIGADGTGSGFGGGLYSASDVSSTDGVFLANRAGVANTGDISGEGGGIALDFASGPDLEITDNLFQQNLAGTGDAGSAFGGAVAAQGGGSLDVSGSNFLQNQSRTYGGALYRGNTTAGAQADTITNSGFTSNTARLYGGAIAAFSDTSMTISNAEIVFNNATVNHGGGIFFSGGTPAASPPQLTIRNATISQNNAGLLSGGRGGGIALTFAGTPVDLQLTGSTLSDNSAQGSGGSMDIVGEPAGDTPVIRVRGSIVEGGTSTFGAANCQLNGATIDYASEGGNIESGTDCDFTLAGMGDLQSTDPGLQPLADNGEVGQSGSTHAILLSSPAVGNVSAALCSGLATDQRGVSRPQGLGCDSGAYEFIPAATTTTLSCTPASVTVGSAASCTAGVVPSGGGFPSGTVSVSATGPGGALSASSCTLASLTGASQCKVAFTPSAAGSHTLTASYTGSTAYASSQDGTVLQAVAPPSSKKKSKKCKKKSKKGAAAAKKKKCKKKKK